MKKIIIALLIVFPFLAAAQNAQQLIDRLKIDLQNNPDAKKKATIYSDLTWYYSNVSLDSAMFYGKKAIDTSTKLGDSTLIAQVYSDLGAVYFRKGDIDASKKSYLSSMEIRKARKDIAGIAKLNANLANIYNKLGDRPKALKAYLATIDYFEKTNNQQIVAATKTNVGILFNQIKNYPKALTYLKEALAYQEKNNLEAELCTTYLSIGNVYLRLKDTVNAVKFYDKTIFYSKKTANNVALSSALNNLGNIKSQQGKSKEAVAIFNKSKQLRDSINFNNDDSGLLLGYAKEYIRDRRFDEAKKLLLKMERSYIKDPKDKKLLLQTYHFLIPTCGYLNQPDSVYLYTNEVSRIEDEIIETSVIKQTNELEAKYQSVKKEKLLLEKEAENKRKNMWLLIISLLTFFIASIGYLIYRQQKIKNKQQEQEFELKSAIAQIETQNQLQEQRLSISRDLHDNIGAQLTFVISSVDNLKYGNKITDSKITNQLTKISDFTKSTIIELRDTIWAMNNSEFDFEDLRSRIFNFIEKAKSAKEDINFKFHVDENLKGVKFSSVIGINLYRTMQEAVNNAVKYAEASEIEVHVLSQNNQTKIEIKDNGKGFDMETIDHGNGLYNMKKRIEEVEGVFEIQSALNKGTTISILLSKNQ